MISLAATLQLVPGFSGLQPGVLACIVEYVGKIFKLQTVKKKGPECSPRACYFTIPENISSYSKTGT